MTNTGHSAATLNWDNPVLVGGALFHGIPPNAPQPGVDYPLDTGDNRFENRSLQVGSRLLNAATISYERPGAGYPASAVWFDFNIGVSPHTLQSENIWYASYFTSSDWHPSVNANTVGGSPLGETFGTWMSVDATNNVNVQLRAIGWTGDDVSGGPGIPVYTSPRALTGQTDANGIHRSGDYSYIALYPAAALGCTQPNEIGILTGETAGPSLGLWGTRVGIVKHC